MCMTITTHYKMGMRPEHPCCPLVVGCNKGISSIFVLVRLLKNVTKSWEMT